MTIAAETVAKELGEDVAGLFGFQFSLTPNAVAGPAGFVSRPVHERTLHHCPKLDVVDLTDAQGASLGVCLGIAVDNKGVRLDGTRSLGCAATDPNLWQHLEDFVIGLAGRYVVIAGTARETRVFTDPCAMFNCVYDPVSGCVGSSLLLALDREIVETDEIDYTKTMTEGLRLPFGRTRDAHARRLAANHFVSLADYKETRFWPKDGDVGDCPDGEEAAVLHEIRDRFSAVLTGMLTSLPVAIGVSGGNDSRNLVAAAIPALGHARRFYTHTFNFNSRTDYRSAVLMMEALGFQVERHAKADDEYTAAELEERNLRFQASTGYTIGLHQMSNVKLAKGPPAGEVLLAGNVMENLRAAFWKSTSPNRRNALKFGLKRCMFVTGSQFDGAFVEKWLPHFRNWLNDLPSDARNRYIDFVFMEHYLPNLGARYHEFRDNFCVCPFNDRRLLARTASLSVAYRFSNQANRDFLALAAPGLVDVPYAEDLRRKKSSAA